MMFPSVSLWATILRIEGASFYPPVTEWIVKRLRPVHWPAVQKVLPKTLASY